jgi:hypothetical protein
LTEFEEKFYKDLFPNISNSKELNNILVESFNESIDLDFKAKLSDYITPENYNAIF